MEIKMKIRFGKRKTEALSTVGQITLSFHAASANSLHYSSIFREQAATIKP